VKRGAKLAIRAVVPMSVRKPLAAWLSRQQWLPDRNWWSVELVADLADRDPVQYHTFLWTNHMGYAESYEIVERFGEERIHPSRRMLFADLVRFLERQGPSPEEVESVFEVGCSMGYLLRHMEESLFPTASRLEGVDIDEYAIQQGKDYLAELDSRVVIAAADMRDLETVLKNRLFDLTLCAGVLMYLTEEQALPVVRTMLKHTNRWLILAGLAHPDRDNKDLDSSTVRESDGSFIHNMDDMVVRAGGRVVFRRWEGARDVHGNTIYFLFCSPDADGTGQPQTC